MRRLLHISILCLLCCTAIPAAAQSADCQRDFQIAYQKMNVLPGKQAKGEAWYMNFSVVAWPEDSVNAKPSRSEVEIYFRGKERFVRNDIMEMYQDEHVSITVVNAEKRILLRKPTPVEGEEDFQKQVLALRDSLLPFMKVKQCTPAPQGNFRYMTLSAGNGSGEVMGATKVVFRISNQEPSILGYTIYYPENAGVSRVEYTFNEINYHYKGDKFKESISDRYFLNNGHLKPPYSTYEIQDLRKP